MINELIEILKFVLGFLPWILLLLLPTDGWDALRKTVVICLIASVVPSWKELRERFILQWCTLAFFFFCAVSFYGFEWIWLARHMGIVANGFLTGAIWFTVLIGQPFALQYARADLPQERWYDAELIRGCRFISIFWGTLLLVPTVLAVFQLYYPAALSDRFYFYVNLLCIIFGVLYTTSYKRRKRKQREAVNRSAVRS